MKQIINISKKELKQLKFINKLCDILATKISKNLDEDYAHIKYYNNLFKKSINIKDNGY